MLRSHTHNKLAKPRKTMPCPGDPGDRPPFIPAPDTARLVMRYSAFGQTIENVLHFTRDGGYDSGTLAALVAAANTSWQTNLKPILPPELTLVDVTATDQSVAGGAQATVAVTTVGTSTQAAFPDPGATLAFKFGTARSGRSYRGRMYWPLLQGSSISAGQVSAVNANQYLAGLQDWIADILVDSGDELVVVSYQNDCEWRTTADVNAVTSISYTDRNLDSQRRRLPGRGI